MIVESCGTISAEQKASDRLVSLCGLGLSLELRSVLENAPKRVLETLENSITAPTSAMQENPKAISHSKQKFIEAVIATASIATFLIYAFVSVANTVLLALSENMPQLREPWWWLVYGSLLLRPYPFIVFFATVGATNLFLKGSFFLIKGRFRKLEEPLPIVMALVFGVPLGASFMLALAQRYFMELTLSSVPSWLSILLGPQALFVWQFGTFCSCLILIDAFLLIMSRGKAKFDWSTFCYFVVADILCSPLPPLILLNFITW